MFAILAVICWIVVTSVIGWCALSLVVRNRALFSPVEMAALSFPVGLGLVSVQMACFSALKIEWRTSCILLCWIPVFLAHFYVNVIKGVIKRIGAVRRKTLPFSLTEKLFVFGISFQVIYAFFKSLIKPMESYDAIAIYALQSKIFYMAKAIPSDFYRNFKDFVPHVEYPLLLPLSESFFYAFLGSLDDILVKVIFPLFFVCLLTVFYSILRRNLERKSALLFTFVLATIPQLAEYATNGYADMLLTFYYSAGLFYLYMWILRKDGSFLTVSFLLSALAVWTKTEALMLVPVNLLVVLIYIIKERRGYRSAIIYFLSLSAFLVSFLFLKKIMGLEVHGDFAGLQLSDAGKIIIDAAKRIPAILYEYQRQFFGPKKWNMIWIIFLFLLIVRSRKSFSGNIFFLTSAVLLIFCGYMSIYMMIPRDIGWHLSTTASRFFIHFVPVVTLWIAVSYEDMKLKI